MRKRDFAKFLVVVAVILGIVVAILKTWFIQVIEIGHNGMAPTLIAGDTVLLWRDAQIDHGDIVLCHHPTEAGRWVLARVLARDGTAVAVIHSQLAIDGHVPPTDYRDPIEFVDRLDGDSHRMRWGWEHLGNDEHMIFIRADRQIRMRPTGAYHGLYLFGDNRTYAGEDSRTFGPVAEDQCVGQVFMRIWASPESPAATGNGDFDLID